MGFGTTILVELLNNNNSFLLICHPLLHPHSRHVVDEDDNGKFRLERVNITIASVISATVSALASIGLNIHRVNLP